MNHIESSMQQSVFAILDRVIVAHRPDLCLDIEDDVKIMGKKVTMMRTIAPVIGSANGGKRDKATAGRMKKEGTRRGVPDIQCPVPMNGYCGLWIEMKVPEGTVKKSQKSWIEYLKKAGHRVEVARSVREATDIVFEYLEVII
jgi:hypothetical protein